MLKALITGVNGFTGRFMAHELHLAGYAVFGITQLQCPEKIQGIKSLYATDLCDSEQLKVIIQKVQPDVVVHLAAISFVAHGNVEDIYRSNVIGTRCLLEALVIAGKPIKSILLASSANVYGNAKEGCLTEETPFSPTNDYAVSKVAMEYVASLYKKKLPIIIIRPFNYTGVGQSENFLLPKIVSHIRRSASVIELGNINVARDFSDVRNVVKYYKCLLETPSAIGEIFNICSGYAFSLKEIVKLACEISGHELEIQVNPSFVRENEVKMLLGNPIKLKGVVGDFPVIQLNETLRWMIKYRNKSIDLGV